ncbi:dTDP-4-amino-4,6-dideoxygalactose transaminase, partial [Candidatus Moduliflexota bacterium]
TANAFYLRGARIVFADISEDTLTMDAEDVRRRLTGRTRVIVPVHYGGVGCDMDKLLDLAGSRRIAVVEDNAHGLFARYRGRNLGTLGTFGALSFHETKNLICGVGGALIINDTRYLERAEIVREKGTDRSRFFRGEIDKYTWVGAGSSYQPSDMLAAFLYAQLEAREQIMAMRRALWEGYRERLADWAAGRGVRLPFVPGHCEPSWHLFYLIMQSGEERSRFISHLKEKDIQSVFHYPPLHLSAVGRSLGGREGDCPVSERVSGRLVRLPFYNTLSEDDLDSICARIIAFP